MNNNDNDALLHHQQQAQQQPQQGVMAYQPNDNNNPQQQPRGRGGRASAEERRAEMENEPPLNGYQRYVRRSIRVSFLLLDSFPYHPIFYRKINNDCLCSDTFTNEYGISYSRQLTYRTLVES